MLASLTRNTIVNSLISLESRTAVLTLFISNPSCNVAREMVTGGAGVISRVAHLTRLTINTPGAQAVLLFSASATDADRRADGVCLSAWLAVSASEGSRGKNCLPNRTICARRLTKLISCLPWRTLSAVNCSATTCVMTRSALITIN